ncbi:hypothetical protein [Thiohalophilus sp.]|uniref:hypothetical protein n=1 Tax=Thiohalophilus sp. TaxID=3028392 RepID=UPI002ACE48C5|nr:hypothetical protein [Thiohalophilus sp.]MDZ7661170.1 hypothetical protein [Thiohalophilus sp.]
MDTINTIDLTSARYMVKAVEKTTTPAGCDGNNWYRYVLERNGSTLVGQRRGTLNQVTRYAEELADDVNSRSGGNGPSQWSSRNKK